MEGVSVIAGGITEREIIVVRDTGKRGKGNRGEK